MLGELKPARLTETERTALSYLPERLAREAKTLASLTGGGINEIRLRSRGLLSLTVNGDDVIGRITVSEEECRECFRALCGRSVYSYGETVKNGYVTTPEGIRAGVCGRAVTNGGQVEAVNGITSISIRIPHRIPGAGDYAYEILKKHSFSQNMLIWSKPGVGKTTCLRELAVRLSSHVRTAVVDTRNELSAGVKSAGLADYLSGYPRSTGIEIAKRTLSPKVIICDEISSNEDADAVRDAADSGITVIASVHAASPEDVQRNRYLGSCADVFGIKLGLLSRAGNGYEYRLCEEEAYAQSSG